MHEINLNLWNRCIKW